MESEEGAILLCQEEHYDCAVVTDSSDLSSYAMIILPDDLMLSDAFRAKITAYHSTGGRVLASFRAGLPGVPENPSGLDFLPSEWEGRATRYPNYWRAGGELSDTCGGDDRVVYLRGAHEVIDHVTGVALEKTGGQEWLLPADVEGRLLLRVPAFFSTEKRAASDVER